MTREADVVRSLVEMADTLVDDYDVVDLLTGLAGRCVTLLGASAAGVMLANPTGSLGLVASSSEAMRLLELFELQAQEGPCVDAFRSGETTEQAILIEGSGQWPSFAAAALEVGFQSAVAIPLRWREVTLGALNLLSATPGRLDDDTIALGQALADAATIGIIHQRVLARQEVIVEQLQVALNSRIVIEQAKGFLAERLAVDVEAAFALLRHYAREHNRKLTEVATDVLENRLAIE